MPTRRLLAGIAAVPVFTSSRAYATTIVIRGLTPWITSVRHASSSRWQARQSRDRFAREAKVQGLKSRAAFKLLQARSSMSAWPRIRLTCVQLNQKYRLFKPGNTVIDLVRALPSLRAPGRPLENQQPS